MKTRTKHRLAVVMSLSLLAVLPVMSASPATALEVADTAAICRTVISTTPVIEVDLDNDGNPEFRAPRIYDVTLCADANAAYVTYPPTVENCSPLPKQFTCMAVRITVLPAYVSPSASVEACFTIEGFARQCVPVNSGPWSWTAPRVVCVGYDLNGGHPCDGSVVAVD